MEVLVEFRGSRKAITPFSKESLLDLLKKDDPTGYFVLEDEDHDTEEGGSPYLLQRWSTRWGEYIDISSVDDVISGEKLKIVPKVAPTVKVTSQLAI